jgi:hypothetical protein
LHYKHESEYVYNEIMMLESGNIYSAEIPASYTTTTESINYYLSATDHSDINNIRYFGIYGQMSSIPGSDSDIDVTITDSDMIAPTIMHEKIKNGIVGVKIALTATVTDDGSGVKFVKIYFRSVGQTSFTEGAMRNGNPFYYEIPGEYVTMSGVEYYLYAVDNSPRANDIYYGNYGQTKNQPASNDTYIRISVSAEDNSPPLIIYGPEVIQITSTSATILWITNEPADSVIDFGETENLTQNGFNRTYLTFHSLIMTDLKPDTLYYYRVSSTDENNNGPVMSNIHTFRTTRPGEEDRDGDGIIDVEDLDDDNDGIPDSWEELHSLNPYDPNDADLDIDNDGYSNLLEYLSDSDPNDEMSNPVSIVDDYPPVIVHEAKTTAEYLNSILIIAIATDNGSGVRNVTLYYKIKSDSDYSSFTMNLLVEQVDTYSYEIPREDVILDDLEYYIMAVDWAAVPNVVYYGDDGLTNIEPDSKSDIDIDVREKHDLDDKDDDDGDFFKDFGEPFGLTHFGVCLLVLIISIVLIICFILATRSAFEARALAQHSTKYKSETADGERITWEGEEVEELDEAEDLNTIGKEDEELQEGL